MTATIDRRTPLFGPDMPSGATPHPDDLVLLDRAALEGAYRALWVKALEAERAAQRRIEGW